MGSDVMNARYDNDDLTSSTWWPKVVSFGIVNPANPEVFSVGMMHECIMPPLKGQ